MRLKGICYVMLFSPLDFLAFLSLFICFPLSFFLFFVSFLYLYLFLRFSNRNFRGAMPCDREVGLPIDLYYEYRLS